VAARAPRGPPFVPHGRVAGRLALREPAGAQRPVRAGAPWRALVARTGLGADPLGIAASLPGGGVCFVASGHPLPCVALRGAGCQPRWWLYGRGGAVRGGTPGGAAGRLLTDG